MSRFKYVTRGAWRSIAVASLSLGLAAPIWSVQPAAAQALLPPTASAAPESTILYHQLDLNREGPQWQQVEELLARVGVPDALDAFESEILTGGADQGDFTEADLDALFGGEMAIVVTEPAIDYVTSMMAMMGEMGGHHDMGGGYDADDTGAMMGTPMAGDASAMATPAAHGPAQAYGVAAILRPGDLDGAWSYVERQFANAATDTGLPVVEESNDDAQLLIIEGGMDQDHDRKDRDRDKDKDKDKDNRDKKHGGDMDMDMDMDEWMEGMDDYPLDPHRGLVAARAGSFIVAGKSREDVNAIVDVIQGEEASLVESANAQRVRAQMPDQVVSFTYVDSAAIVDAVGAEMIDAWAGSFGGMTAADSRAYEGIAISAEAAGFRFDTIQIPAEGATLQAATVANDPDILTRAERAPSGTFLFLAGGLPEDAFAGAAYGLASAINAANAGEAYHYTEPMMQPPTPEEIEAELEEATTTLGFNPQTELFDLLGGDYIAMASLPTFTMSGFGWDAVLAVGTTDTDALADTAQRLAAYIERSDGGVDVATRQADADTVYAVSDPEMGESPALQFGVVADQAVIGVGNGITQLNESPADNLAGDAQFQEVMATLPAEAYQIGYVDFGQVVDLVMGFMAMGRNSSMATPVSASGGSPENIRALGAVAFTDGETAGSSAILYIGGGE